MTPDQRRGLVAAIAAVSIFAFGLSLTLPLLAILLERMGASGLEIGLNGAAAAVAMLAGGLALPRMLDHVPLPALLAGSIAAMAGLLLVFPLVPDVWVWLCLRFFLGFANVAIFYCSEIWIIGVAPAARRGLMIGVYAFFLSLGFVAGPALLSLIGPEGWRPFLIGAGISLLALPPVIWAWSSAPAHAEEGAATPAPPARLLSYFRTDPAVMFAILLFGCVEFGAMGLFPVWGLRAGMTEQAALFLVTLIAAGNVAMQAPMGWLGDRFDRRRLLMGSAAISLAAALAFPWLADLDWPLWALTAFWGGAVVGLYTFALTELGARYSGAAFARANGAFMFAYGLGSLAAPPLMGAAMDAAPPHGMFAVLAAASGAYLLLLTLRTGSRRRRNPPAPHPEPGS